MLQQKISGLAYRNPLARQVILRILRVLPRGDNVENKQPNLIIIGAQKSGTTSLHNYLNNHPEIFMSNFKEPGYFLNQTDELVDYTTRRKLRLNLNDDDLLKIMKIEYRGEKWFGESSTYYSMSPYFGDEASKNIRNRSPDSRIIYIVRDPISRIVSQYLWGRQNNFTQGEFEYVFKKRLHTFLAISSYAQQLKRYLNNFERDRILVIKFEQMIKNPKRETERVFEFLGLNSGKAFHEKFDNHNKSRGREKIAKDNLLFTTEMFDSIVPLIKAESQEFAELTGIDISDWDFSYDRWTRPVA